MVLTSQHTQLLHWLRVCFNYASCFAVAVYLCGQYTPGARDQGTALLLCVAVTNADYKTSPPKCAQKIGKSSKTSPPKCAQKIYNLRHSCIDRIKISTTQSEKYSKRGQILEDFPAKLTLGTQ